MSDLKSPEDILSHAYELAEQKLAHSFINDEEIKKRVENITNSSNKSGARVAMTSMLAKLHKPEIDVRKPYTEIDGDNAFSGRSYDERYISPFNHKYELGLNSTSGFLTPAFRNINYPLTTNLQMEGRPKQMYQDLLNLLDDVYQNRIQPDSVLNEFVRLLIAQRNEKRARIASILGEINRGADEKLPPSSEMIIHLIQQHLNMKNASRLPVLVVAAAYKAAENKLGERVLPLYGHNSADEQTGAFGDVHICLVGDNNVVTVYEMKDKPVTKGDIDTVIAYKLSRAEYRIDNYLFITTVEVANDVTKYAASMYEQTGGTEIAILDCMGFARHFLHLFHRLRLEFLNAYQELVLAEPESAINYTLKENLLVLRRNIETAND